MVETSLHPHLQRIPGTEFVVIKGDTALSAWAMKSGDIRGEKYIRDLACVKALKPGDLVIDAGAFIGDTAILFLDRGADVIAIEAYDDAFAALEINCPTARCIHAVVGDGKPMRATGRNVEGNKGNRGCSTVENGGNALSLRIDDLDLAHVTAIKADVEGCEMKLLVGAAETIRRCGPWILIECYDAALKMQGTSRAQVLDWLWTEGYAISVAIGRNSDGRVDYLCVSTHKPLI